MPKPGQRVQGTVYRILSDRVLLRLPGELHGIIRQRELTWDSESNEPNKTVKINDVIDAVVLVVDVETRGVELSLRFVQRDPWQDITQRLPVGKELDASVLRVRDFGTFVELEAGVEGFVPATEKREQNEPLWPEDVVRVVVTEFDLDRRQIRLSRLHRGGTSTVASQRSTSAQLGDFINQKTLRQLLQSVGDLPVPIQWPASNRIISILIADDNVDFKRSLVELLQEVGYMVSSADTAENALEVLEIQPCDLAILDLSLSVGDPLDLAKQAKSICPDVQILLLSGFEIEVSVHDEAEKLGFRIESKPLGPRALAVIFRELENGGVQSHSSPYVSPSLQRKTSNPASGELNKCLCDIVVKAKADYAILFERDMQRPHRVLWPHCYGIEVNDSEDLHATLLYSPVGEVLRDRRSTIVRDSRQVPRRVRYLARAVLFNSCIGIPLDIPVQEQPYALFLFSRSSNAFSEAGLSSLKVASQELGMLLFRQHEFTRFVGLQGELLQSRLRAGALHDIRNTLGSMSFKLNTLENLLEKTGQEPAKIIEAALSHTLAVQTFAEQMERTTSLLRDLAEDAYFAAVDVNAMVHRLIERQQLLASHLAVRLTLNPGQGLPFPHIRPAQLQQVLDNIILNGLQWCQGRKEREVEVSTEYQLGSNPSVINIRISDTGPGIHKRLQASRIFDLGFSRREGGSGIGLFVSRALMESMGGAVVVEHSIMDVGTTFLIIVPVME